MNYELARKLRDAGWDKIHIQYGQRMINVVNAPTLSELIEACGDGLQSLIRNMIGGWIAFTNAKDESGERMSIKGSTPEEAVANLWLALQDKT